MRVAVVGAGMKRTRLCPATKSSRARGHLGQCGPVAPDDVALGRGGLVPDRCRSTGRCRGWGASTYEVFAAEAAAGVPGVVMREALVLYRDSPKVQRSLPAWAARSARAGRTPRRTPAGLSPRAAVRGAPGGDASVPALSAPRGLGVRGAAGDSSSG